MRRRSAYKTRKTRKTRKKSKYDNELQGMPGFRNQHETRMRTNKRACGFAAAFRNLHEANPAYLLRFCESCGFCGFV